MILLIWFIIVGVRKYFSNVLIYVAALCGIIAFIGLFASPLQIQNEHGGWSAYNVGVYFGDPKASVYKGVALPIFGYIVPFLMSIFLIVESFKPSLDNRITIINTLLAILYFASAVVVLLTKELWLQANGFGETTYIRNGAGPIMAAILSFLAGALLLIVTWVPSRKIIDYIDSK